MRYRRFPSVAVNIVSKLQLFLGRPILVDLMKVGLKCPSVRTYVRPSVHKKFLLFQ